MISEENVKDPGSGGRPSVLSLNIKERSALYAAYMPHLKRGGIFIPTIKPYRVGDEVFLLLSIPHDPNKIPIAGRVVWVTPANNQANKTPGVGVHFSDDESGQAARRRIEAMLGGLLESARTTHTY
jgi:type IV pilus assembly protein PilZ